jgi:hypothetical protein
MQSTERAAVQVRLNGAELESLDEWRRGQHKIPPRSEALREAIRQLVRRRADALPLLPATDDSESDAAGVRAERPTRRIGAADTAATAKPGRAGQP